MWQHGSRTATSGPAFQAIPPTLLRGQNTRLEISLQGDFVLKSLLHSSLMSFIPDASTASSRKNLTRILAHLQSQDTEAAVSELPQTQPSFPVWALCTRPAVLEAAQGLLRTQRACARENDLQLSIFIQWVVFLPIRAPFWRTSTPAQW